MRIPNGSKTSGPRLPGIKRADMSDNLSELLGRRGLGENLFDRLGQLARTEGSPDEADLARLAEEFLVGKANTFGTATFYAPRTKPCLLPCGFGSPAIKI